MATTLTLWLDFNNWVSARPTSWLHAWYWRVLLLALGFTYTGMVVYSRILLGVHSINQVVLGVQMGAWTAFTLHFIAREPLINLADGLINAKERYTSNIKNIGINAWNFLVLAVLMECLNYGVALQFENPEKWTTNMKIQCD